MITTALTTNSFVCSEKIVVYSVALKTILMKDWCHALEIFFKLNEDRGEGGGGGTSTSFVRGCVATGLEN